MVRSFGFDVATNTWQPLPQISQMPMALEGHAACVVGSSIYVCGGTAPLVTMLLVTMQLRGYGTFHPPPYVLCSYHITVGS